MEDLCLALISGYHLKLRLDSFSNLRLMIPISLVSFLGYLMSQVVQLLLDAKANVACCVAA